MKSLHVGFIGLGLMGQGMAENILDKGFELTIMAHRNRQALEHLCSKGAREVQTPSEMAACCDVIFLCVGTSEQIEGLVRGKEGILAGARPGLVVVDCSTARPDSTLDLAKDTEKAGCFLLDAPLARTPKEAREGRLNVMVGGDEETFSLVRPVINTFAENIYYIGEVGSAHKLKLINNFLALGSAALISEAAVMAAAMDVDLSKLYDVCSKGGANSAMLGAIMPYVLSGDDSKLQFSIANAHKDMTYLQETLKSSTMGSDMLPGLYTMLTRAKSDVGENSFVPSLFDMCAKRNGIYASK